MKHLNLELEKLEQRIAPGGIPGPGCCNCGTGSGKSHGSKSKSHGSKSKSHGTKSKSKGSKSKSHGSSGSNCS